MQDPETKETRMVQVPWAEAGSRWTLAFEALAVEVLRCARSVEDGRKLRRVSWETAPRLMERAATRGMARRQSAVMPWLGIEEPERSGDSRPDIFRKSRQKSFGRGQRFMSILTDIKGRRVLEVTPGASQQSGPQLMATLRPEPQPQVAAGAMDRSPAYVSAVEQSLPQADIVHDACHLAADLNKAGDDVRRQEHRVLLQAGEDTLTGTKYLWLSDPHNLSESRLQSFTHLAPLALKTARAWECTELFKGFYEQPDAVPARGFFLKWDGRAMRSRLPPVKKVARSFMSSLPRILTWFSHRLTNAAAAGFHSVIQALKSAARGFRNADHYRIRILFHCGKLSLQPS